LGVGNIGGMGHEIVRFFKNRSTEWSKKPSDSALSSV
jgi:hypothetical protein